MLVCRLVRQFKAFGNIRASNTLNYERMHVNLKAWATSSKYMLGSIKENYSRTAAAQLQQFKRPRDWVITGRKSSLFNKTQNWADQSTQGAVAVLGKKNYRPLMELLSADLFSQLKVQNVIFVYHLSILLLQNVFKKHEITNCYHRTYGLLKTRNSGS